MHTDYYLVTELPGQKATKDQLSMMLTRYHLAKIYGDDKTILEVACGSGTGLGYLSLNARKVVGGDIDPKLVNIAKDSYKDVDKVDVIEIDAHSLPFEEESFDLILIYEAIYYLSDIDQFLEEVKRVLNPSGKLIISTVNRDWHGFNPSPHSIKYYSITEIHCLLEKHGFFTKAKVGFEDSPRGSGGLISIMRKIAVAFRLIPNTMEGKEKLKRIFYGKLIPIPKIISKDIATIEPLIEYDENVIINNYKFYYTISSLN